MLRRKICRPLSEVPKWGDHERKKERTTHVTHGRRVGHVENVGRRGRRETQLLLFIRLSVRETAGRRSAGCR